MAVKVNSIKNAIDRINYANCMVCHEMHFSLLYWVFSLFLNSAGGNPEKKTKYPSNHDLMRALLLGCSLA